MSTCSPTPWIALAITCCALGCGPHPYNYARTYQPLSDEEPHLANVQELSLSDVANLGHRHEGALVAWFGVVREISWEDQANGRATLSLDLRAHQARHLCADETEGSCRLTVSDRTIGTFRASVTVRPEHRQANEDRLWTGSLVKVYGTVTGQVDEDDGPLLETAHYRHWPHGTYVTTASAGVMRR